MLVNEEFFELETTNDYPVVSQKLFRKAKKEYINKVFFCPDCSEYYCFGFDQVESYCNDCMWDTEFKSCKKRYVHLDTKPMAIIAKPCMVCEPLLSKIDELGIAEGMKIKKRKKNSKLARLLRRRKERKAQKKKKKNIISISTGKASTLQEIRACLRPKKSVMKKNRQQRKSREILPRQICVSWKLAPSMVSVG